jgi:hypothetical protein
MNSSNSEQKLNTQKMSYICDEIIRTLELIKKNKETYNTNKEEMLRLVKMDNPNFYNLYPRICRSLVYEDDISPLLGMIQTFGQVQEGKMTWNKANDIIQGAINAKYIDPVLNSDKLVKEREEKQKQEGKKIIDISEH